MTAVSSPARRTKASRHARRRRHDLLLFAGLLSAFAAMAALAAGIGAAGIPANRLPAALGLAGASDVALQARDHLVLWSIRLPRIAMAAIVGAFLAAGGTIMQGLFRNPLADPALVGVSSGGALAATGMIVVGDRMFGGFALGFQLLPIAAFVGSLATTLVLHAIAARGGRIVVAIFLLGGLAIAALTNAALGLLVFVADDQQLRDITFWMLGSLGGATWNKVMVLAPLLAVLLLFTPFITRGLDLIVLGEAEAFHMGIDVERLKRLAIILVSAMAGAAVAFTGVIGFVGIVVPHLLRLAVGPGHGRLLPASLIFGALLLLAADTVARTIAAPAEVPIGILTAIVGAPFFLALLLRSRGFVGP